jgi:hypothetical protein
VAALWFALFLEHALNGWYQEDKGDATEEDQDYQNRHSLASVPVLLMARRVHWLNGAR